MYLRIKRSTQSFTNPPIYDNQIQSSNNFPSHSYRSCTSGTLPDPVPDKARTWYSLTWTCELPHDDDVVYFASCYPYTYSQLQDYLTTIRMNPYQNKVCEQTQLCTTLAGNSVPLLTVTEPERRVKSALVSVPVFMSFTNYLEGPVMHTNILILLTSVDRIFPKHITKAYQSKTLEILFHVIAHLNTIKNTAKCFISFYIQNCHAMIIFTAEGNLECPIIMNHYLNHNGQSILIPNHSCYFSF